METALGISTSLVNDFGNKSSNWGLQDFNNNLIGLSFIIRENIISLKFESGYSRLNRTALDVYVDNYSKLPIYVYDTVTTNAFYGFVTVRVNFSKNKINPFLGLSLGVEGYYISPAVNLIENTRLGFGAQYKIEKKYLIEAELGVNKWNELLHTYNHDKWPQVYPYMEVSFYWVIIAFYK